MLSEAEIGAVWRLLGLRNEELLQGSRLRRLLKDIEQLDAQYGLNLVSEIRNLLTQIAAVDAELASATNIRKESIDGEYSLEYGDGGKTASAEARRRSLVGRVIYIIDPTLSLSRAGQFGQGQVFAT